MWNKKLSKSFLVPTLSRESILKPNILKIIGPVRDKQIIEFGCGSGYWTRSFRDLGAICVGIDTSKDQINLAKSIDSKGITYIRADAVSFRSNKKFDVVFIDHILSETASFTKASLILKRARYFLKKNGILVFSEMHPSVIYFPLKNIIIPKGHFYFRSGSPVKFKVKQINNKFFSIRDYHWTLQDFSTFLEKASFFIDKIVEPQASEMKGPDDYLKQRYKFPTHIIIRAVPK